LCGVIRDTALLLEWKFMHNCILGGIVSLSSKLINGCFIPDNPRYYLRRLMAVETSIWLHQKLLGSKNDYFHVKSKIK
jgi:hypothetical protein